MDREKSGGLLTRAALLAATAFIALPSSLAAQTAAASPETAPTQDVAEADTSSDMDIVVTAQFREQRLQDTPIAITAVNSGMLEARSQSNLIQIASAAPNVTMKPTVAAYGNAAVVSIRGVGQIDYNFAYEPGVGVYIDDVYYPTVYGSQLDLLDLDRVEILRGPQGTLAGKNSIGGAVKLYSKKPTGSNTGFIEGTYGSFNRMDLRASADLLLVPDQLFLRLSGVSKRTRGYVTRKDYGCVFPGQGVEAVGGSLDCVLGKEGKIDFNGLRASLRWTPTSRLEVNLIGDVYSDDSGPTPAPVLYVDPTKQPTFPLSKFVTGEKWVTYTTYANPAKGYSYSGTNSLDGYGLSGQITYDLNDDMQVTSITAYRSYSGFFDLDGDGTPYGLSTQHNKVDFHSFTQEVRLNGSIGDLIDYTVGGFYYDGRGVLGGRVNLPTLDNITGDVVTSDSKSGFVHAVLHATDALNFSAGLRYTDESKFFRFVRKDPSGAPVALNGITGDYSKKRWDYRFNVDYRLSDAVLLYANVATGFKGGGINPKPFVASHVVSFGPESMTAFEIGAKTDLFDRLMRFNVSAFFNKYKDIQLNITNGFGGFPVSNVPFNAGRADVKGFEIETDIHPTGGLTIDGSLSYLDFQYKYLIPAILGSGITYDMVMPFTSKWKASGGIQYEIPLGGDVSLTPRFDIAYQSEFWSLTLNRPTNRVPDTTLANARLTLRLGDGLEGSLVVTNLFDKYYYLNKYDGLITSLGTAQGTPGRPREWAVTIKKTF